MEATAAGPDDFDSRRAALSAGDPGFQFVQGRHRESGGIGDRTLACGNMLQHVYLHGVGGAAQVLAECMLKGAGTSKEEFGRPKETIWELEIVGFQRW